MRAVSGPCSPLTCEPQAWVGGMHAGCGRWGSGTPAGTSHVPDTLSYSIVIEGERGNRQRIYSLEQLLQEAVSMVPGMPGQTSLVGGFPHHQEDPGLALR